jgi:hypothetical protein
MTTFAAAPPLPEEPTIAILGLGYVGLPLAIEFGKHFDTIGFDHASARIAACQQGCDPSGEIEAASFAQARRPGHGYRPRRVFDAQRQPMDFGANATRIERCTQPFGEHIRAAVGADGGKPDAERVGYLVSASIR